MSSRSYLDPTDTPEIDALLATFSGQLAFDIGASGGGTAAIFAEHFDHVVACEPSVEPFRAMISYVPYNVTPLNVAVSDVEGPVMFDQRQMSQQRDYLFTGHGLREWGPITGHVEVPATTLAGLAEKVGQPDFIKIDTEGHEVRVAQGGIDILRAARFVIEVHSEQLGHQLEVLLPEYRVVRHEWRRPDTQGYWDHYWMVNE